MHKGCTTRKELRASKSCASVWCLKWGPGLSLGSDEQTHGMSGDTVTSFQDHGQLQLQLPPLGAQWKGTEARVQLCSLWFTKSKQYLPWACKTVIAAFWQQHPPLQLSLKDNVIVALLLLRVLSCNIFFESVSPLVSSWQRKINHDQ